MSRDFHFYKLSSNTASWTADNLKISHCTQFISGFEGRVFTNFENASRIARARVGEISWWATDQHHSKISKCSVRSHRSRGSWGGSPDRSRARQSWGEISWWATDRPHNSSTSETAAAAA